jgi:glycosyltransferase involved in cell wall biosynthesis
MKLAYVIPSCGVSGGIAVVCQHANRLLKRGHEVYLLDQSGVCRIDWFPGQRVPILRIDHGVSGLDAIIATGWSTSFVVAELPARHKFYFVQSDETRFHPSDSEWCHITRLSYLLNFQYLTEAKWIQKWLCDEFGHAAGLVPNGVDPNLFHPSEPIAKRENRPRVLLEGAIGLPFKGMEQAFAAVSGLDVDVWCISSFGKPPRSWKVDRFFESVPISEMKRLYSSCDVLLKLSRVEGFPGPPLEMMACGGACVVGWARGYDEYIVPDYNALVVDPLDIAGARAAVKRLIEDKELRARLIRNGQETAAAWRWEPSIDKLESYLLATVRADIPRSEWSGGREADRSIAFFYRRLRDEALSRSQAPPTPLEPAEHMVRLLLKNSWFKKCSSIAYHAVRILRRCYRRLYAVQLGRNG